MCDFPPAPPRSPYLVLERGQGYPQHLTQVVKPLSWNRKVLKIKVELLVDAHKEVLTTTAWGHCCPHSSPPRGRLPAGAWCSPGRDCTSLASAHKKHFSTSSKCSMHTGAQHNNTRVLAHCPQILVWLKREIRTVLTIQNNNSVFTLLSLIVRDLKS